MMFTSMLHYLSLCCSSQLFRENAGPLSSFAAARACLAPLTLPGRRLLLVTWRGTLFLLEGSGVAMRTAKGHVEAARVVATVEDPGVGQVGTGVW